jgi:hemolysin activation/secretion protein
MISIAQAAARPSAESFRRLLLHAACACAVLANPEEGWAQIRSPSQVTPPSLRPSVGPSTDSLPESQPRVEAIPPASARLDVLIGKVRVQGTFAPLARKTDREIAKIRGRRLTVAEIYAIAAALERLYADAGYTLARVVLPPQKLIDGGTLTLAVVDGFIEAIDVAGVPGRVRGVVKSRVRPLIGRREITQGQIERALVLAGQLPGLKLKSTLVRGTAEGGVRLVLEGEHRLVTGEIGVDNRLAQSLGTWQLRGTIAVNGALGYGEQIYARLGRADPQTIAGDESPLQIGGGGAIVPLGANGLTLNPEYTHSNTLTPRQAAIPGSSGKFDRFALRLRQPVVTTRNASLNVDASVDYLEQSVRLPEFDVTLNDDRYGAARIGADYGIVLPGGTGIRFAAVASQGLGGRSNADAIQSGIPLSRMGASPDFSKVTASARISQPLLLGMRLDLATYGQTSFGKPLMQSEQFALDGPDAVSAFAAGTLPADQGVTFRGELARPIRVAMNAATLSPYVFGAAGRGWLMNPTAVEQPVFDAGALGAGLRSSVGIGAWRSLNVDLELARQFTDVPGLRQGWRGNLSAVLVF